MIGGAALGRPWLVGDIAHYSPRRRRPEPTLADAREHHAGAFEGLLVAMGGAPACVRAKHVAAYADRAFEGAAGRIRAAPGAGDIDLARTGSSG